MALTTKQIENIQIDYGIVYINYGEPDAKKLGPVRGGGEFKVDHKIRDIEYDEMKGKTKGMQAVESIDASLNTTVLDTSMEVLQLAMPFATLTGDGNLTPHVLTCKGTDVGMLGDSNYLKNVTMFAKTIKGSYRKITLFNAMVENGFELKAKPKAEGEISLEFNAHWSATDDTLDLFKVETIDTIV